MLLDKHELLISGKKIFGGVRWAGGVSMVGGATKGRRVMDTQRGKEPAGLSLGFCSCSARSGNSRLRLPHTHTETRHCEGQAQNRRRWTNPWS